MMDFYAVLDQVLALLRQRGRVSYRALKRQFDLDDAYLERIRISGTFQNRAKVVDSLLGYTSGMAGCRHNLALRGNLSMRL